MYQDITVEAYKTAYKDRHTPHLLLDVRTTEEFHEARIPGAYHIPLDELQARIHEVSEHAGTTPIVVVCRSGVRSIMGAQILRMAGIQANEIFNLDTGTLGWAQHNLPLERGEA